MGSTAQMLMLIVVVAAILCGGARAEASPECMKQLLNASDCLTYVSSGSNLTKPELGCCPELAGLVEANPACLCHLIGGDISSGLQIDVERALNLTSACSLSPLPLTSCSQIGIPVGAPSSAQPSMPPGATSQSAGTSIRVTGSSIAASALAQLLILSIPIAFVLAMTF